MRLNREKVALFLAAAVFLFFGLFSLVRSQFVTVRSYSKPPDKLSESTPEVLAIDPRLHTAESIGRRDPFLFSTDWQALLPEPLPAPPVYTEPPPRLLFGFLKERMLGSGVPYQERAPSDLQANQKSSAAGDARSAEGPAAKGSADQGAAASGPAAKQAGTKGGGGS